MNIAVIGAGPAGRAFTLRCAQAGHVVVLEDVMPANLRHAQDDYSAHPELPITYASTVDDAVREADIAIDFVPDELESKLEIFSLLDRMAPPRTILLTPSESQSITDLASCTYRSPLCFAVRKQMSELVRSRFTDEAALATAHSFLKSIGLEAVIVPDDLEPKLMRNLR